MAKKAESMQQMSELKKQLSENKLQNLYLFFGEETFLIDFNINKIAELVPDMGFPEFNRISLNGSDCTLGEVSESLESFPMMAEKKLVIIKDSGAFKARTPAAVKDFYTERINSLSDDTVLILRETDVDKRSAVYKAAQKKGWAGEFSHLDDTDLITWVIREAKNLKRKISRENAALLISLTDRGLYTLKNEIEKLALYTDDEITSHSIDTLTSRSMEAKVFDLCDKLMVKDAGGALSILEDVKTNEKSAFGILYSLYATFSKILKARILTERHETYDAFIKELGVPRFSVKKYTDAANRFTKSEISGILIKCVELDLSIKRGLTGQWQAVETLILYATERVSERK